MTRLDELQQPRLDLTHTVGWIQIDKTLNLNTCPYLLHFISSRINLWLQKDRFKPYLHWQELHRVLLLLQSRSHMHITRAPQLQKCIPEHQIMGAVLLAGAEAAFVLKVDLLVAATSSTLP